MVIFEIFANGTKRVNKFMEHQTCFHCGLDTKNSEIIFDDKSFCCNGCKTVYEILNANELGCYYDFETTPGTIPSEIKGKYNYLENESIVEKLLAFNDGETSVVAFFIPSIHCSSCIWVLENLSKLNKGVTTSMVNFPKKLLRITFKNKNCSENETAFKVKSNNKFINKKGINLYF